MPDDANIEKRLRNLEELVTTVASAAAFLFYQKAMEHPSVSDGHLDQEGAAALAFLTVAKDIDAAVRQLNKGRGCSPEA